MNGMQAIGTLIIRIWAFTMLYPQLSYLVQLPLMRESLSQNKDLIFSVVDSAIWFVIVLSAWFLSPRIARRAIPDKVQGELTLTIGEKEFVAIGSFLIAGFFIVSRLPYFISTTLDAVVRLADHPDNALPTFNSYDWTRVLAEVAVLLAMLSIAGRPRDIAQFFLSLRPAASPRDE